MLLRDIIKGIEILDIKGSLDIEISNIEFDSRKVTDNTLFVCIKGFSVDGHDYIKSATESGATAFLVEEDIEIEGYTFIKVKNTRCDMAKISCNFFDNPSSKMDIIGVTGTNGKTSITTFLSEILSGINKVGIIGTIKIFDGDKEIESKNTTPESIDLQRNFDKMVKNNCKNCVMEVSSHSLVLNRVDNTNFKIGIFTNLTPDHLDFHKDLEDYRNTKEKLFYKTSLKNIINIDDDGGKKIYQNIKNLETEAYTYGIDNDADFMAKDIKILPEGVSYRLITPTYEENIFVPVSGKFTVYNTLAVIATCYSLGIGKDYLIKKLESINGVSGRFESVVNDKSKNIIVDYAHTPDALENVINTAREFTKGKVITVFGCGGDRDKTKRPLMGKIASDLSDFTIITSDNPRTENQENITKDILKGITNNNYEVIEDRKEAIKKAIIMSNESDIVLIAGKGHENYQIIGNEKTHFDDKEEAIKILDTL